MTWSVEDVGPYVLVRTAGTFDVNDHMAMVTDILARLFWRAGRDSLFDHRALSFDGAGYSAMTAAAETHRSFDSRIGVGHTALVMGSLADYGIGRMFDGMVQGGVQSPMRVFTDIASAEAWLAHPD